ncbi:MAG: radical SAM protein [Methanomassiliicoccaceae archaeon]|jgi:MoaA/NifB/PqqE/SkfB family radical SAM enzyme|nr:radical SAM protein [Methanomassiliicoccaceae archaeon]
MAGEMFGYAKWWLKSMFGSKAPLVNTMIIQYACNLRCKHCSIHSGNAGTEGPVKTKLSYDEIVNDLRMQFKKGARIAYFEGGEPTMWSDGEKDLGDIIKAAKDAGYTNIGYTTNGTNRFFTGSDVISVSLDGPKEVHDLIRGEGVYDDLMDKLAAVDFSGSIYANMVLQKDNIGSIDETAKIVRDNEKLAGIIFNFITPPPSDLALTPDEKRKAIEKIRELKKEGYPILNSKRGLELLAEEDWSKKCPYHVTVFIIPDGSHYNGCPMAGTPSCEKCGFAAVREYYLIKRGSMSTISEMSSIFAMSKK